MALCLDRFRDIRKTLRLTDARFEYTEPHSKRLKLRLTVEAEVDGGAKVQQSFQATLRVVSHMCDDCHRVEAKNYWQANVQVRQRRKHKKTLLYLEQVILKHRAHAKCSTIRSVPEGLDFFFGHKEDAKRFTDFVISKVPAKYLPPSKKLISADLHNNTHNCKYTYIVDVAPICKDDVICLPANMAQRMGNLSQICLVHRVTDRIHLIDPRQGTMAYLSGSDYWRAPFAPLNTGQRRELAEYMVVSCEAVMSGERRLGGGHAPESRRHVMGDAVVMRTEDMSTEVPTFTHLGHLLKDGDLVLGFEVRCFNVNNADFDLLMERRPESIPDVLLLRKVYEDSQQRKRKRTWKLRRMRGRDSETASTIAGEEPENNEAYLQFLEDLEEDPAYRKDINVYRDHSVAVLSSEAAAAAAASGAPQISLEEMLDDLHLGPPGADATGADGDAMME